MMALKFFELGRLSLGQAADLIRRPEQVAGSSFWEFRMPSGMSGGGIRWKNTTFFQLTIGIPYI